MKYIAIGVVVILANILDAIRQAAVATILANVFQCN
jgi:hypothetical protein